MSKTAKRAIWVIGYLIVCWATYQVLGWLGPVLLVAAGALGGISTIFINRKIRRDEHIAQFRKQSDPFSARGEGRIPEK